MRCDVSKPKFVRGGDFVRVQLRLPKDVTHARLSVWSAIPGFDPAPHVQFAQSEILQDGKPIMVKPMYATLYPSSPEKQISFVADEDLIVVVRQEKDIADEPSARARIKSHGKTVEALRRRCGNALRIVRGYYYRAFG